MIRVCRGLTVQVRVLLYMGGPMLGLRRCRSQRNLSRRAGAEGADAHEAGAGEPSAVSISIYQQPLLRLLIRRPAARPYLTVATLHRYAMGATSRCGATIVRVLSCLWWGAGCFSRPRYVRPRLTGSSSFVVSHPGWMDTSAVTMRPPYLVDHAGASTSSPPRVDDATDARGRGGPVLVVDPMVAAAAAAAAAAGRCSRRMGGCCQGRHPWPGDLMIKIRYR